MTTFETAKICHVSPGSVVRWVREGKLPAFMTAGGHHRIRRSDLVVFLKKLRIPPPSEFKETTPSDHCSVVSSNLKKIKQIQKTLRQRFPEIHFTVSYGKKNA